MVTHSPVCESPSRLKLVYQSFGRFRCCVWLVSTIAFGCSEGTPSADGARRPTPGCRAPAGVQSAPRTIDEVVTLINALPKPLSLPCFLESLERPLEVNLTYSLFSAQPAQGTRSPRIFLFRDPTVLSIVPEGDGAALLEFGEQRPEFRSLKAEITFPVSARLERSAPFDHLLATPQLTTCGGCHAAESQETEILGVPTFVSQALRPRPQEQVSLASLNYELEICDRVLEPRRCAMLDALLGWGPVNERSFPVAMPTFGGF